MFSLACVAGTVKKKKNAGLFQPNFGSNMDKTRRWFEF